MASLASLVGLGTSLYDTLWGPVWLQQATVFMLAVMQHWVPEDVEVHVTAPASSHCDLHIQICACLCIKYMI